MYVYKMCCATTICGPIRNEIKARSVSLIRSTYYDTTFRDSTISLNRRVVIAVYQLHATNSRSQFNYSGF